MTPERADFLAIVGAMAQAGFVRWWNEFSHKHGFCKCHALYFIETPCEIRREEMYEERQRWLWSQWDGLGLGYIGPRLSSERKT